MERTEVRVGKAHELDREERERWAGATPAERFAMITYLRECFYGPQATTGRLQRVHTVFKRS